MRVYLYCVPLRSAYTTINSSGTPPPHSPTPFYVANAGSKTITAFTTDDTGNVAPTLTIGGASTGLNQPEGILLDPAGVLIVTSISPPRILVFAAHAVGDVAPTAIIGGTSPGLAQPKGLALDASGRLYVANWGANSIVVFAGGASGNVAPLTTISGANTALNGPEGISLDLHGRVYVTNALGNSITIFNAGASGNVRPTDTIVGASTGLNAPRGIALDPVGRLYVANSGAGASTSSVTVYESGAKGNAAPIDTITGTNTALDQPQGVALDPAGRIYVANSAFTSHQYRITVYGAVANGNVVPAVTLAGNNTGLTVPSHLSF